MAAQPKKVPSAQITDVMATYYTVPPNTIFRVMKLQLVATTANARTVSVYYVPSGGTADDTNIVLDEQVIPPKGVNGSDAEYPQAYHVLEAGTTIQAIADVTQEVTLQISGILFYG
jgi:hypothetical protein